MFTLHLLLLAVPPGILAIHSEYPYERDHPHSYFKDFPCPNAEDIAPCTCTYLEDESVMDMECKHLADEQELYEVFQAAMPDPNFRRLELVTKNIGTLSYYIFGNATFEEVVTNVVVPGTTSHVGPKTFINSLSTLRVLLLYKNELTENDFPFDTLSQYTALRHLSFYNNHISVFPSIESSTLKDLDMGNNPYREIPAGALDNLPNLEYFWADATHTDSMATGIFASLPHLKSISMAVSHLGNLNSLQFEVNSNSMELIDLPFNGIASIEENTFKGVTSGIIALEDNLITLLPENSWRPLVEAGVVLKLKGNDLLCGCDVAWLVLEPSFHGLVEDATCQDGEKLVDLDPTYFENNC